MSDALENALTKSSVGFMRPQDYKRKREELEEAEALANLRKKTQMGEEGADKKKKKKKDKDKDKRPATLSFEDELDAEPEESPSLKPKKMAKCQDVDASFLKKNEREEQEQAAKQEEAMKHYLQSKRAAAEEEVVLSYCFRSETTQREVPAGVLKGSIAVKCGACAEAVARAVAADVAKLGGKFAPTNVGGVNEERDVILVCNVGHGDSEVRGSFVIPPAVTLVELMPRKWVEGTSLFDGFKNGVIVTERRWYEQWRHSFPYSMWHQFMVEDEYSLKAFVANRNTAAEPLVVNRPPPKR